MTSASPNQPNPEPGLPGGLWRNGQRRTDFAWKPVIGALELIVAESRVTQHCLPRRVTRVLSAALAELCGEPPTEQLTGSLCVADRQFLIRRLAAHLGTNEIWLTVACDGCQRSFDVPIVQTELPVKPAGDGFPFVTVRTSIGPLRFRAPSGHDQDEIARLTDSSASVHELLRRCLTVDESATEEQSSALVTDIQKLTTDDLQAIDRAFEKICPEVAVQAQAECPECCRQNLVDVSPYLSMDVDRAAIYFDIHVLAAAYHWSETDILALPRERRRLYLKLIDRSQGVAS